MLFSNFLIGSKLRKISDWWFLIIFLTINGFFTAVFNEFFSCTWTQKKWWKFQFFFLLKIYRETTIFLFSFCFLLQCEKLAVFYCKQTFFSYLLLMKKTNRYNYGLNTEMPLLLIDFSRFLLENAQKILDFSGFDFGVLRKNYKNFSTNYLKNI